MRMRNGKRGIKGVRNHQSEGKWLWVKGNERSDGATKEPGVPFKGSKTR